MTKISLRVYNREIEGMIESGQVEEAIAHCHYIFKTFPMHLETYRLLGKAYLETRRYSDAGDIFQRVLMAVPEDFVSHVGMSIIRDDENKLDEAIWHMERAFEVQPSNPAIQDELRKLYGRRDGVQPPKVRLTRDALANMYTQGALYSQAIAEIRAVLADDPNRPDLQVMLARAYSKDGRKKQAIEICTELLKKYPYCFDALRILIDLMPPSDQNGFTQTYRLRVRALDPYAGFVTGSIFNSDSVPDTAVNLELLDYDPNDPERGSQPAWASSLGIKLDPDKSESDVPDWLSEKPSENRPLVDHEIQSSDMDPQAEQSSEIEDVPEWMRSSGWEQQSDQTLENAVPEEVYLDNDEPIAKAEIPEWLRDMEPEEAAIESEKLPDGFESMLDGISMNNFESDNEVPDWLINTEKNESIMPEKPALDLQGTEGGDQKNFNSVSSEEEKDEGIKIASEKPVEDVSSWMGEVNGSSVEEPIELDEKGGDVEDLPVWLKEMNPEEQMDASNPISGSGSVAQGRVDEIPANIKSEESDQEPTETGELPDWLKEISLENQDEPIEAIQEPVTDAQEQVEEVSSEFNPETPDQEENEADELPEWLRKINSEKQVADSEIDDEPVFKGQDRLEATLSEFDPEISELDATEAEELPEWLQEIRPGNRDGDPAAKLEPVSEFQDQFEENVSIFDSAEPRLDASETEDLPDWLNEIETGHKETSTDDELATTLGIASMISSESDIEEISPEISEWEGIGPEEENQTSLSNEPIQELEPLKGELHSEDEQDAAMAWLESLAARQGAKSEELLTKPEERMDEPPEWVKNSIDDEIKSFKPENDFTLPSSSELSAINKADLGVPESKEEIDEPILSNQEELPRSVDASEQETQIMEKSLATNDQDDFSEVIAQEESDLVSETYKPMPDINSLYTEVNSSTENSGLDELIMETDNTQTPVTPREILPEKDGSQWLNDLDVTEPADSEESITPKIAEYYGSDKIEPLPDWLKEIEKDSSPSEWISESERLQEQKPNSEITVKKPVEKDIDDIGEIFPSETSSWAFEETESEPEPALEPINEAIKPVTTEEWLPVQPEDGTHDDVNDEASATPVTSSNVESPQAEKLGGTGMLSKIPAKDIEKEAGTLEKAQSFIESGEIKKAIDVYGKLIKKGQLLEGVIHDLRESTYRFPVEIGIWQLLGDAYMRANRLQDALDAYTKAEELLR